MANSDSGPNKHNRPNILTAEALMQRPWTVDMTWTLHNAARAIGRAWTANDAHRVLVAVTKRLDGIGCLGHGFLHDARSTMKVSNELENHASAIYRRSGKHVYKGQEGVVKVWIWVFAFRADTMARGLCLKSMPERIKDSGCNSLIRSSVRSMIAEVKAEGEAKSLEDPAGKPAPSHTEAEAATTAQDSNAEDEMFESQVDAVTSQIRAEDAKIAALISRKRKAVDALNEEYQQKRARRQKLESRLGTILNRARTEVGGSGAASQGTPGG